MGKCVVKNCNSYSQKHNKESGIHFYVVPKDPVRREKWVKIIRLLRNESHWFPSKYTTVCSKHFRDEDKIGPKNGIQGGITLLSKEAVPMLVNEEDDAYVVVVKEEVNDEEPVKVEEGVKVEEEVEKTECEELEEPQYPAYDHEQPFFLHVPDEVKTEYEDTRATEDEIPRDMLEWHSDEEDTDYVGGDTDYVAEDAHNAAEDTDYVAEDALVSSEEPVERWICGKAPDEERLLELMQAPPPPLPDPLPYFFDDDDKLFRCKYCPFSKSSEGACVRHYRQKHGSRYIYCFACGSTFTHVLVNLMVKNVTCGETSPCVSSRQACLYKHEMKKGRCRASGIQIVRRLRKELLQRQEWRKNCAPRQGIISKFFRGSSLCTECGVDCGTVQELRKHEFRTHSKLKRYQCHHCPAAYNRRTGLCRHLQMHSKEPSVCSYCGKSFVMRDSLNLHIHRIHREKRFKCSHCPKEFTEKRSLLSHEGRHTGAPPPHPCKFCSSRFWRTDFLKSHMEKLHGYSIITKKKFARLLPYMTSEEIKASLQGTGMATFDSTPRQCFTQQLDNTTIHAEKISPGAEESSEVKKSVKVEGSPGIKKSPGVKKSPGLKKSTGVKKSPGVKKSCEV